MRHSRQNDAERRCKARRRPYCSIFAFLIRVCCRAVRAWTVQGPRLRYIFSEVDLPNAEEVTLHVRLEQDANGNELPTMTMLSKSDQGKQ